MSGKISLEQIRVLLESTWHECRLTAVFILVRRYEVAERSTRKRATQVKSQPGNSNTTDGSGESPRTLVDFYLENLSGWIRANSSGRRISNLFAHTGSLGVAAAAGGARSVVHVDNKKSPLDAAREHHVLNDLPVDSRSFIVGNVYQQLARARRGTVALDGIILDPPPVVPRKLAPRKPKGQDYPQLSSLAAPLLSVGGWLLCFFSRFDRTRAEYERDVLDHAGTPLEVIWRGTSGVDFPAIDAEQKLRMTVFERVSAS